MKVEVNIYLLIIYIVLLIGAAVLITSLFNGCKDKQDRSAVIEQKIDSVKMSIKENDRLIDSINKLLGVNDSIRTIYKIKYVLKKEQIKEQPANKDYEQIKDYLNNYN